MSSEHIAAYAAGVAIHQFGVQGALDLYNDLFSVAMRDGAHYSELAGYHRTISLIEQWKAATTQQQGEIQ